MQALREDQESAAALYARDFRFRTQSTNSDAPNRSPPAKYARLEELQPPDGRIDHVLDEGAIRKWDRFLLDRAVPRDGDA